MARPTFQNEVLGMYNGSFEPQYRVVEVPNGIMLELLNPISQRGTSQNADNMNNLFNFDNLASMRGNKRDTIFNADGSITETIQLSTGGAVNAKRNTIFATPTSIIEHTIIYDDTGVIVLRDTTITTDFTGTTQITEAVS